MNSLIFPKNVLLAIEAHLGDIKFKSTALLGHSLVITKNMSLRHKQTWVYNVTLRLTSRPVS